jgi:hypothetical protein
MLDEDDAQRIRAGVIYASDYAGLGWYLLPIHAVANGKCTCGNDACQYPAKHPRTARGLKDASSDIQQIKSWTEQWLDVNIAVHTGRSGLVVLDFDSSDALDNLIALLEPKDRPVVRGTILAAPSVKTSNGFHAYFVAPDGIDVRPRIGIAQFVDVRGGESYVLLPPSKHIDGVDYVWANGKSVFDLPLAELPSALADRLSRSATSTREGVGRSTVPKGDRDAFLTSQAGTLWNSGLTAEATESALLALNESVCEPPLDDAQIRKIAKSAERNFERWESLAGCLPQITVRSVRDIVTNPLPPPEYLVNQFLLDDQINLISGVSYAGKSKIALDLSISMAAGISVLGHPSLIVPNKRRVLYLYGEQSPTMWDERVRAILKCRDVSDLDLPLWFVDAAPLQLSNPAALAKIISYIEEKAANVVVFDPIGVLSGISDENDAPTIVRELRKPLGYIQRATGVTPILVHHASRPNLIVEPYSAQQLVRGSGDFWAMTGAIVGVWRKPKTGHVKVLSQGRIESVNPFRLVEADSEPSSSSPLVYDGEWDSGGAVDQRALVMRLVDAKGRITRRDVEEELGIRQSRAGQLLAWLVVSRDLRQDGTGRSACYVRA